MRNTVGHVPTVSGDGVSSIFIMAATNRKYLSLSTRVTYLRNSNVYKYVFRDGELNGTSSNIVRRGAYLGASRKLKMAATNRKYLYLSTRITYLRNSNVYKYVFRDGELNGPSPYSVLRGFYLGESQKLKMAAKNRKYLYFCAGITFLRNSKSYAYVSGVT